MVLKLLYIFAWGCTSSTLVILNAHLLQKGFHFPITLCSMGLGTSWMTSYALIRLRVVKLSEPKGLNARWYFQNAVPIGGFTALSLALGNYAYLYLSVPFIQMLKASGPCVTMIVLSCLGLELPNHKTVTGVVILCIGTALTAYGEYAFNWTGTILMLSSEVSEALRLALMQHLAVNQDYGLVEGLYRWTPATLGFLVIGILYFEQDALGFESGGLGQIVACPQLYFLVSILGFFVNLLTFAVIKHVGSLTLKVCGQVRSAVIVFSGVYIFGSMVSSLQAIGYSFSFLGCVLYHIGRHRTARQT